MACSSSYQLDPGPLDRSVLIAQHTHRSRDIWDGKPDMILNTRKCDGNFWKLVKEYPIHQRVLDVIICAGFYGVYRSCRPSIDRSLITSPVERWRPETHTFHFRSGEATVTLQDVEVLYGLPVDGDAVIGYEPTRSIEQWQEICTRLSGFTPSIQDFKCSVLKVSALNEHMKAQPNLPDGATEEMVHQKARCYIFWMIAGMLMADTSGNYLKLMYLPMLEDVDRIGAYSWGSATLACLYRNLCRASQSNANEIAGFLPLLQIWAWERITVLRPQLVAQKDTKEFFPDYFPTGPLAVKWYDRFIWTDTTQYVLSVNRDTLDSMTEDHLMMLVDYGGSIFPSIAHSPWNGVHLADFVMPFFLFIAGASLAIVHKKVLDRKGATLKAVLRTLKLFLLGVFLQGGYLHGITGLTYGVDIEKIRWLGILQRIAVGYIVAALSEIWLPHQRIKKGSLLSIYIWQWCIVCYLCAVHTWLLYGLYVPDWKFSAPRTADHKIYEVKCSIRGDLGPACNSAGMIDRSILGIDHLYTKPVYNNLKECKGFNDDKVSESLPSWCHAPFEPEGILSSITAAAACIIGLQYGHILVQVQDHKERLYNWSILSFSLLILGIFLAVTGVPLNKSLYTVSYLLVTSAAAGITFCFLYVLVDIYGWRRLMFILEWMGKHSLKIFILIISNVAVIFIQGFYWKNPHNNIVRWIV